jgi:hypothetical protein
MPEQPFQSPPETITFTVSIVREHSSFSFFGMNSWTLLLPRRVIVSDIAELIWQLQRSSLVATVLKRSAGSN